MAVLGHQRLAIIDLTDGGRQPRASEDGRFWITYNGELYNHLELRAVLEDKYPFRSRCDTETLLWAYVEWGPACLDRFNGMFALAVWDARVGRLWLARDRLGIKPLYYWTQGDDFRFASEVKALTAAPDFRPELDANAADCFLRLRYVLLSNRKKSCKHDNTAYNGSTKLSHSKTSVEKIIKRI